MMLRAGQSTGIAPRGRSSLKVKCSGIAATSFRASSHATEIQQPDHSPGPLFINGKITLNPVEWAARTVDRTLTKLDVNLAGWEAGRTWLQPAIGVAVGVMAGLGVAPVQLLYSPSGGSGLELLCDLLNIVPGTLASGALYLAALALSLPLALAHLRIWWLANRVIPSSTPLVTGFSQGSDWGAAALAAGRAACLTAAAMALSAAAPAAGSLPVSWGVVKGAALVVVSLLLLPPAASALGKALGGTLSKQPAGAAALSALQAVSTPATTTSRSITQPMAMAVLSDIAYMVLAAAAVSPVPLVVRAAAGAAMAASLALAAASPLMSSRLDSLTVSEGDEVAVHVSVALDNGIVMDTTMGGEPLRFTVGKAAEQLMGAEASQADSESSEASTSTSPQRSRAAELAAIMGDMRGGPAAGAPTEAANNLASTSATSRRQRFHRLAALVDEAVVGSLQGQQRQASFYNPPLLAGGFVNPALTWWQAVEDVQRKFKTIPEQGQVFFYPIRPGEFVPVRVGGANSKFVELDANYSLEDATAVLQVRVVDLVKGAAASQAQ